MIMTSREVVVVIRVVADELVVVEGLEDVVDDPWLTVSPPGLVFAPGEVEAPD
jgi:hypothetical protein